MDYKGYKIIPKKDFGSVGFWINGRYVIEGWLVTKDGCNIVPGAGWFINLAQAESWILNNPLTIN